jgi:hypothetical protein
MNMERLISILYRTCQQVNLHVISTISYSPLFLYTYIPVLEHANLPWLLFEAGLFLLLFL